MWQSEYEQKYKQYVREIIKNHHQTSAKEIQAFPGDEIHLENWRKQRQRIKKNEQQPTETIEQTIEQMENLFRDSTNKHNHHTETNLPDAKRLKARMQPESSLLENTLKLMEEDEENNDSNRGRVTTFYDKSIMLTNPSISQSF